MIKTFADAAASVGKAVLLLALPLYLVVDATRYWISDSYRETRAARHEALCFNLFDEETGEGDEVLEAQRQAALPMSLVGKLDLFLQCATITEIGLAGIKLQQAEQNRLAQLTQAHADGVEALEASSRELVEQAYEAGWMTAMGGQMLSVEPGNGQIWQPFNNIGFPQAEPIFQNGVGSDPVDSIVTVDPQSPTIGEGGALDIALPENQRAALDAVLDAAVAEVLQAYDPASTVQP